jgi:hypothetical protein
LSPRGFSSPDATVVTPGVDIAAVGREVETSVTDAATSPIAAKDKIGLRMFVNPSVDELVECPVNHHALVGVTTA